MNKTRHVAKDSGFFARLRRNTAVRLTGSLLLSMSVIVLILILFTYRYALGVLEHGAASQAERMVRQAGVQTEIMLDHYKAQADNLVRDQLFMSNLAVFSAADSPEEYGHAQAELSDRLRRFRESQPAVHAVTVFSADLERVVTTLRRDVAIPELRPGNAERLRALEWFGPALSDERDFHFLDMRPAAFLGMEQTGTYLAGLAKVKNPLAPEDIVGYLFIEWSTADLARALKEFRPGEGGGYVIVNRDGNVVFASDQALIGGAFPPAERGAWSPIARRAYGGFHDTDENGVPMRYSYWKLGIADWVVVGFFPREEYRKPMRNMLEAAAWIATAGTLASALVIGALVQRGIGSPLRRLRQLMRKGEEGNLMVRSEFAADNEIGELGRAFDRMMDRIALAYYDTLTNLPNRRLLVDRLETILADRGRSGGPHAVLFVDLDRFKMVNDSLGHHAGDALLNRVALRLAGAVEQRDLVARISGDEFVILLPGKDERSAMQTAERLLRELRRPYRIREQDLYLTASIGIAMYPEDAADAESLIKHADMAMFEAKAKGKNAISRYHKELTYRSLERIKLESDLYKAIENQELALVYQPRMDARTGEIVGLEALIRWHHPELGLVAPDKFIPLAEENGLIMPIGEWVLREACRQQIIWQHEGCRPICIAVNVSPRQFGEDLDELVERILQETGSEGKWLEIEITEQALMRSEVTVHRTIRNLKQMGVRLSIDDFGTGYSSLAFLMHFEVDTMKIDKSFVKDIHENKDHQTIVGAMIQLAHNLGIQVVAEGVESKEEMELLKAYGADELQGYFISEPLPADECRDKFLVRLGDARNRE